MHRNLGVFTGKDPLSLVFAMARKSEWFYREIVFILVPTIQNYWNDFAFRVRWGCRRSANKLKKNGKITAVFTGEGATSEGDFHEALNIVAVWELPVLFVIENNGYGLRPYK
jgi:2-oxoisovalerate dehydrogenase E1 component